MAKCTACRKEDAIYTWWEKKRYRLMFKLFSEDVANLVQEKYTQGFGDGMKKGYFMCMNQAKTQEEVYKEMSGEELDSWITKV